MLNFLTSFWSKSKPRVSQQSDIQASQFDAMRKDPATDEHFRYATLKSADAHASQQVRQEICRQVRYEYMNSSWLQGIVLTRANTVVGKGVRLILESDPTRLDPSLRSQKGSVLKDKLRYERRTRLLSRSISEKFNSWATTVKLGNKLRSMVKAKLVDGESFLAAVESESVQHPIKIFPRVFDCDRVNDSTYYPHDSDDWVDGISYDQSTGEPLEYRIQKSHPHGEYLQNGYIPAHDDYQKFDRNLVFHYYRQNFGEQHRGVSEILPSLDTAAILRRVRKSIAIANETAANLSMGLFSKVDEGDEDEEITLPEAWTQIPSVAGTMTVFPNGLEPKQIEAKHPNSQYEGFRDSCLSDMGRSIDMPFNRVSGSSASYNFSSAMNDGLHDLLSCEIERDVIRDGCLSKLFKLFIAYALDIDGYLSVSEKRYLFAGGSLPEQTWYFETEGNEIDPGKMATAQQTLVETGAKSITSLLARKGVDVDIHDEELARENGVTIEELRKARFEKNFTIVGKTSGI